MRSEPAGFGPPRFGLRWIVTALAAIALVCCGPGLIRADKNAPPVRVFAASSLTEVMNRLGRSYAATGHSAPAFNFAASSDLARQIEQGAEADIFVSADEAWMDYLSDRDLIVEGSRVNLAGNRLVLIAPADRPFSFTPQPGADLAAALKGGTLAIADPEGVPAGRYAREALESIGAWGAVEGKAARAESVRAALRFVESGEAAAGIVYATDALSAGVKVVVVAEFPAGSHTAITYPLARIASGEGQDFAAYLQSGEARSTLAAAGFLLPE